MGLVKVIPTGATNGTVGATGTVTIGNAVSSVTVSNAFSSLYEQYVITVSGGVASAGNLFGMSLGASATGYYQTRNGIEYSTGARTDGRDNNTVRWTAVGSGDANGLFCTINLANPSIAKYTYGTATYDNGTAGVLVSLAHKVATAYTDFTFTASSGTWTGGTIRVYGYRN
jgi:hypothetical protein